MLTERGVLFETVPLAEGTPKLQRQLFGCFALFGLIAACLAGCERPAEETPGLVTINDIANGLCQTLAVDLLRGGLRTQSRQESSRAEEPQRQRRFPCRCRRDASDAFHALKNIISQSCAIVSVLDIELHGRQQRPV